MLPSLIEEKRKLECEKENQQNYLHKNGCTRRTYLYLNSNKILPIFLLRFLYF